MVKGERTCSKMAPLPRKVGRPLRDENNYGHVLHDGTLDKKLCREYLTQWLRTKGAINWPFKGAKFEMLLRDFETKVN